MLGEIKNQYKEVANFIPKWKEIPQNELCETYLELKEKGDYKADWYLAAIVVTFWSVAERYYGKQGFKCATQEDCYEILIDVILYVLDKKEWRNPNSTLYGDEKAIERAVNQTYKSRMVNFFVATTRDNRKANLGVLSSEYLSDELFETLPQLVYNDGYGMSNKDYLNTLISNYFNTKQFEKAFILDAIINDNDVFVWDGETDDEKSLVFSPKRLKKHLLHMDDSCCRIFADEYGLDYDTVLNSLRYVIETKSEEMDSKIEKFLNELRHNKEFRNNMIVKD